jgi:hypothetical protein
MFNKKNQLSDLVIDDVKNVQNSNRTTNCVTYDVSILFCIRSQSESKTCCCRLKSNNDAFILLRRYALANKRYFGCSFQAIKFNEVIIDAMMDASDAFNKIIRPSGKRDSPARTCRELMQTNSQLPDGEVIVISLVCCPLTGRLIVRMSLT